MVLVSWCRGMWQHILHTEAAMPKGHHLIDLTGQDFGHLRVLERRGSDDRRQPFWFCRCRCGKTKLVRGVHLRKGRVVSCGCWQRERNRQGWKGYGKVCGDYMGATRKSAHRRGHVFEIDAAYAWALFQGQGGRCKLTGVELVLGPRRLKRGRKSFVMTASLDRIDSTKGYVVGNLQWVHKVVNFMKQRLTQEEFIQWCRLVAKHNKRLRKLETTEAGCV